MLIYYVWLGMLTYYICVVRNAYLLSVCGWLGMLIYYLCVGVVRDDCITVVSKIIQSAKTIPPTPMAFHLRGPVTPYTPLNITNIHNINLIPATPPPSISSDSC